MLFCLHIKLRNEYGFFAFSVGINLIDEEVEKISKYTMGHRLFSGVGNSEIICRIYLLIYFRPIICDVVQKPLNPTP